VGLKVGAVLAAVFILGVDVYDGLTGAFDSPPTPYYVVTVNPPGYHPVAFGGVSTPLWWSVGSDPDSLPLRFKVR